jgi:hypothetical protein
MHSDQGRCLIGHRGVMGEHETTPAAPLALEG